MSTNASDVRHAFPGYRVFIFGQEVTDDVVDLVVSGNVGNQPSVCTVTLLSPLDRYMITDDDINKIYDFTKRSGDKITTPVKSTSEQFASVLAANRARTLPLQVLMDPIKARVVSTKISVPTIGIPPDYVVPEYLADPGASQQYEVAERYPFYAGRSIFHAQDQIRVFMRDPFDPSVWYWKFSGFLSDYSDTDDENNVQTITLVAEDPSKLLRYGRYTTNAGLIDISQKAIIDGIVADIAAQVPYTNMLQDMTLPEIFHAMLFGAGAVRDEVQAEIQWNKIPTDPSQPSDRINEYLYSVSGVSTTDGKTPTTIMRRKFGVGHINLKNSCVYVLGSDDLVTRAEIPGKGVYRDYDKAVKLKLSVPEGLAHKGTNLEQYQDDLDHKVKITDLTMMLAEDLTHQVPDITDVNDAITYIGTHPELYPVDGGRLVMLLPPSMGMSREIITRDLISSFNLNTEWSTRAETLYDAVSRIDFVFYVSPKGDYVVEFPLVDFEPRDFGKYEADYTIEPRDTISVNSTFTDSRVMTQVSVPEQIANWQFSQDFSGVVNQHVTTLWHLIPQFGVRTAPMTVRGYLTTPQAARLYAGICLNRINADAYTQAINMMPRVQAWLNRPFLVKCKQHIGTTKSITDRIRWGTNDGDCGTELGLGTMRGWDGTVDAKGNPIYYAVGGAASRPFDYARLLGVSREPVNPKRPDVTVDTGVSQG